MPTTTIRLPDDLKENVARLAEMQGTSPHNFMLEAIAQKVQLAQAQRGFLELGEARAQHFDRTGLSLPLEELRQYYRDLSQGKPAARPRAHPLKSRAV